ncbi:hypothetical protein [Amycolatopsis kentuckyensis]|uniref:hypothetical protein n=1 Tax=Amycolatopsis kentuckyensis TaxID=218823 RepID=UPI003566E2CB
MSLAGWVVRDGVLVRAASRVLVTDGTTWFEPPFPRRGVAQSQQPQSMRPGGPPG